MLSIIPETVLHGSTTDSSNDNKTGLLTMILKLVAIIIDEAKKLFYKLIKDCVNKTVANLKATNLASDSKPSSSSSLSLLPRKELSDVQLVYVSGYARYNARITAPILRILL